MVYSGTILFSGHHTGTYLPKVHLNVILPFMPRPSKWSLPFGFSDQNFVCLSHLFCKYC